MRSQVIGQLTGGQDIFRKHHERGIETPQKINKICNFFII